MFSRCNELLNEIFQSFVVMSIRTQHEALIKSKQMKDFR